MPWIAGTELVFYELLMYALITLSTSDRKSGVGVHRFAPLGLLSSLEKKALGFVHRKKPGMKAVQKDDGNLLTL
jgi:hypothetical protein